MTTWSARQVAGFWIGAGGPRNRAVEWTAIALGESSFDDAAVSPAGAIGLWQIMPFNAGPYGYTPLALTDPGVNARVAVLMSGHGTNCAAWDSAYANIYATGRYSFLAWPQPGSADYHNLAVVSAMLGGSPIPPVLPPGNPGIADQIEPAVQAMQEIAGRAVPGARRGLHGLKTTLDRMYRPRWRP